MGLADPEAAVEVDPAQDRSRLRRRPPNGHHRAPPAAGADVVREPLQPLDGGRLGGLRRVRPVGREPFARRTAAAARTRRGAARAAPAGRRSTSRAGCVLGRVHASRVGAATRREPRPGPWEDRGATGGAGPKGAREGWVRSATGTTCRRRWPPSCEDFNAVSERDRLQLLLDFSRELPAAAAASSRATGTRWSRCPSASPPSSSSWRSRARTPPRAGCTCGSTRPPRRRRPRVRGDPARGPGGAQRGRGAGAAGRRPRPARASDRREPAAAARHGRHAGPDQAAGAREAAGRVSAARPARGRGDRAAPAAARPGRRRGPASATGPTPCRRWPTCTPTPIRCPAGGYVRANMVATLDGAAGTLSRIEPRHQRAGGRGGARRAAGAGGRRPGRGRDGASRGVRSAARAARLRRAARCGGPGDRPRPSPSSPAPATWTRLAAVGAARRDASSSRARPPRWTRLRDSPAASGSSWPARTTSTRCARSPRSPTRGLRRVLVEGGPTLLGAVRRRGRVWTSCASPGPRWSSAAARPGSRTAPPTGLQLRAAHLLEADGLLLGRWTVVARRA